MTWKINGTADLAAFKWRADSFNLPGFDADPAASGGPAGAFFTGVTSLQGQPLYRLDAPSGAWLPVASTHTIRRGEAYWVFSQGATTFPDPVPVFPANLNFGPAENEKLVTLTNNSAFPASA